MNKIFEEVLKNIPDYKEFLTVEEMDNSSKALAEKYSDVVEIFEMGRTRANHPLYCLKIGQGKENALMFGCPHPNEPIGAMMLEYFTEELAKNQELRDAMDYTFYIIKSWDADGTKLNENWFKKEYTLYNYARNFFRPAGHKQVDWTFPVDHKNLHFTESIPETKAMMTLIDEIKPKFIYSLHNAGFGGTYWYITHDIKEKYQQMRESAIKNGVPLNLGEPEAPYCIAMAPAVYKNLGIQEEYDYLEKYGVENPEQLIKVGTCSADYALKKYDSLTLLTELPYFYESRISDLSESNVIRKDAVLGKIEYAKKVDSEIIKIMKSVEQYVSEENPFRLALEAFTQGRSDEATIKMVTENPEFEKKATVSEEFDNNLIAKFYKMLSLGMLTRLCESEKELLKDQTSQAYKILEENMEKAEAMLKKLNEYLEKEMNYQVVPIKKLIAIQLECGLIVGEHILNNN